MITTDTNYIPSFPPKTQISHMIQALAFFPINGICDPSLTCTLGPKNSLASERPGNSPILFHMSCSCTWPGVIPICWEPQRYCHSGSFSWGFGVCLAS